MFTNLHQKSDVSSRDKAASSRVEVVEFWSGRRMQGLKEGRTASSVKKKEGWKVRQETVEVLSMQQMKCGCCYSLIQELKFLSE